MATIDELAQAIIRMEGSMQPGSVNMTMVATRGLWNVGHLVWAGQRGAVPVEIGGRLWAGWPTYADAYAGLIRQIQLDASRGLTLEQFIRKYAPASENATDTYLSNVSAWTGIAPNAALSQVFSGDTVLAQAAAAPGQGEDASSPLDSGSWIADSDESEEPGADVWIAAAAAVGAAAVGLFLANRL